MRGYGEILRGDRVNFVLVGGSTYSTATFARWFWVHTVVVPLAVVAVGAALTLVIRRERSPRAPDPTPL